MSVLESMHLLFLESKLLSFVYYHSTMSRSSDDILREVEEEWLKSEQTDFSSANQGKRYGEINYADFVDIASTTLQCSYHRLAC